MRAIRKLLKVIAVIALAAGSTLVGWFAPMLLWEDEVLIIVQRDAMSRRVYVCGKDRAVESNSYSYVQDYDIVTNTGEAASREMEARLFPWEYQAVYLMAKIIEHSEPEDLEHESSGTGGGHYVINVNGRIIETSMYCESAGALAVLEAIVARRLDAAYWASEEAK